MKRAGFLPPFPHLLRWLWWQRDVAGEADQLPTFVVMSLYSSPETADRSIVRIGIPVTRRNPSVPIKDVAFYCRDVLVLSALFYVVLQTCFDRG